MGDELFNQSQVASEIDAMISHVWSAGRWLKALSLLYYLNGTMAFWACILASLVGTIYSIMVWGNGDYAALGGDNRLVWSIQIFPVFVYLFVLVCGHIFCPCLTKNWWLDKICIHQSRRELKAHGVTSLPEVVAFAKRMVVLW